MKLEFLCEMELAYRPLPFNNSKVLMIKPYSSEEGSAYGEGDGLVKGEKLSGAVRWVNHPHRRSDGLMLPDVHGAIKTQDGAIVMFSMTGRTFFVGDQGKQLLNLMFEAQEESYRWLNTTLCIAEGVISAETATMHARVFSCIHEMV